MANRWDRKFRVTFTVEVKGTNFPESKISGDIMDQITDLTKQFAFDTLDCGTFEISIAELEME